MTRTPYSSRAMPNIPRLGRAIVACAALGAASAASAQTSIDRWLVLGPTTAPLPFGSASSDSARLDALRITTDKGWPSEGATVAVPGGETLRWQAGNGATADGSVTYAAAYV